MSFAKTSSEFTREDPRPVDPCSGQFSSPVGVGRQASSERRPYLRHAFASLLLVFGTVLYVSRQLGHSSAKLTLDTYGHVVEEGHRLDREGTLRKPEEACKNP